MKFLRGGRGSDDNFEAEIQGTIQRYAVSWYNAVDHIDPRNVVEGATVPIARGTERVAALQENVEQAKFDRDGIRDRYEQAQRDGLFDLKRIADVGKETREKWLAAIDTQRGDRGRCISELRHWRLYVDLATKGELPELNRAVDARELADAKS